jgi:hypothetical protein
MNLKMGIMSEQKDFLQEQQRELSKTCACQLFYLFTVAVVNRTSFSKREE